MQSRACTTPGIIPAHAGKTLWSAPASWPGWDHPRSRGENGTALTAAINPTWIIPAHAGKTTGVSGTDDGDGDHPRSRGENPLSSRSTRQNAGSSPLTRGKLDKVRGHQGHGGIIPAHAGKTAVVVLVAMMIWDHPRSRGENW